MRALHGPIDRPRRQLTAALLFGALALPSRATPAPEIAEAAFRTIDFDWHDTERHRDVPVRLYWPQAVAPGAALPLVVFSHGIGGSRRGYSYLGRHWASHGVASLHVQHVGSDSALWRGNPFSVIERLRAAAHEREAVARVQDLRFALDQLLGGGAADFASAVDPRRIIVAGHSYGANTSLLAVGARVPRGERWLAFRDPRFAAAIVISAPPFYGETDLAAVLGEVAVPTLHVTATEDVIQIPGLRSGAEDRFAVFDAIADRRKWLVVYEGGSHSMFTDRSGTGGVALNPQVKAATQALALTFFSMAFDGDESGLAQWRQTWQPILARPLRPA